MNDTATHTDKPLTPRRASAALRKAGISVQHCVNGGVRGMDVLCWPSTDVDAVVRVLQGQGWMNVRINFPYVFASFPDLTAN